MEPITCIMQHPQLHYPLPSPSPNHTYKLGRPKTSTCKVPKGSGIVRGHTPKEKNKGGPRFSMTWSCRHVSLSPLRILFCLRWENAVAKTGTFNLGWILESLEELLIQISTPHRLHPDQ